MWLADVYRRKKKLPRNQALHSRCNNAIWNAVLSVYTQVALTLIRLGGFNIHNLPGGRVGGRVLRMYCAGSASCTIRRFLAVGLASVPLEDFLNGFYQGMTDFSQNFIIFGVSGICNGQTPTLIKQVGDEKHGYIDNVDKNVCGLERIHDDDEERQHSASLVAMFVRFVVILHLIAQSMHHPANNCGGTWVWGLALCVAIFNIILVQPGRFLIILSTILPYSIILYVFCIKDWIVFYNVSGC